MHHENSSPSKKNEKTTGNELSGYKTKKIEFPYTPIPHEMNRSPELDVYEFRIFWYLASYNPCFPSMPQIHRDTGISLSKIKRVISKLRSKGYLIAKTGVGRKHNTYYLTGTEEICRSLQTPQTGNQKSCRVSQTPQNESCRSSQTPLYKKNNINKKNNTHQEKVPGDECAISLLNEWNKEAPGQKVPVKHKITPSKIKVVSKAIDSFKRRYKQKTGETPSYEAVERGICYFKRRLVHETWRNNMPALEDVLKRESYWQYFDPERIENEKCNTGQQTETEEEKLARQDRWEELFKRNRESINAQMDSREEVTPC